MPKIEGLLTGRNFYCSVCMTGYDTEAERDAHTQSLHPDVWEVWKRNEVGRQLRPLSERRLQAMQAIADGQDIGENLPIQGGKGTGCGRTNEPTEKQVGFLRKLRSERGIDDDTMPATKQAASSEIDRLLKMPKPVAPAPERRNVKLPDIPAGHYALDGKGKNETVFYRVDRPESGKWEGYTFVKSVVGGRPDQRVPFAQVASILERIEVEGVNQSALRYGQEIGRCCKCNRTLTDDESRTLGIGPECAKKL